MMRKSMASINVIKAYWDKRWEVNLPKDRCWVCTAWCCPPTRAHIIGKYKGGSYELHNIVLACKRCNTFVESVECESGYGAALHWVRRCITHGWSIPPISRMKDKLSEIRATLPSDVSDAQFSAMAFKAFTSGAIL